MDTPQVAAKIPKVMDLQPGTYWWCACGLSKNQPFCDGSHKVTSITPMEFKIDAAQKCALCQCKQTKNKPFCDGTHRTV